MQAIQISKKIEYFLPSLRDSIQKIVKDEGYITCIVELKCFDSEGGNFLGELYEIYVNGETVDGEKETNIFVKKKIILNKMNMISSDVAYLKEMFMYNDLSKVFTLLQNRVNVPLQERYRMPKSYDVTNTEAVILENLSKKNFKTYNRLDVMPLKYAELAIKELAKFHALSFVIESEMPEYFYEKIKSLNHPISYNEDWCEYIRKVCTYIANIYNDDVEIKKKVENFVPTIIDKFPKYNNDKTSVTCTLTHGDYKMNNVLVREQDGQPVDVIPVDYQFIDYGCPIRDFLRFIFFGSDQEFRRKNLDNLKELYFTSLSNFLKYFEIDVETVYPKREFEKVYSEWLNYGLMVLIFGSGFLFAPKSGIDVQDIELVDMPLNFDGHAKYIIRGWIDDFIQWGCL